MVLESSGTVSATTTTTTTSTAEYTIYNSTSRKAFVLTVDLTNMVFTSATASSQVAYDPDVVELTALGGVISGGSTSLVIYRALYRGAQNEPVKISVPVPAAFGVAFVLAQKQGVGRSFDWNVTSLST